MFIFKLSDFLVRLPRPFHIIKVPQAEPVLDTLYVMEDWYEDPESKRNMDRFGVIPNDTIYWSMTKSYLNYLITNDVLSIPQFGGKNERVLAKDSAVRQIFERLYPNRKIVGIDPTHFDNGGGGGMHCRHQTQPKIN